MNRKKGILFICPSFYPILGGSETFYIDFIKHFTKNEHQLYVVTCGPPSGADKSKELFKETIFDLKYIPCLTDAIFKRISKSVIIYFCYIFPFLFISSFITLWKNRKNIDLIYSNSITAGTVGVILSKLFKKKSGIITHGAIVYENSQHAKFFKYIITLYSNSDLVFSAGNRFRKDYINHGIPGEKIVNYIHWVDANVFKPMDKQKAREKLGLSTNEFICFYAGRLVKEKGIKILLNASIDPEMSQISFHFSGNGSLEKDVIKASSKNKNIQYVGWLDQDKLALYYNAANVVIMPSLSNFESFNRTLVEALYSGTPIIASSRGEMVSTVDPSVGILIEPTIDELKSAIKKLSDDLELYEYLRSNCYSYSQKKFSERNAEIFLSLAEK